jgi:nitrous oxidase accessory protein
MTMSAKKLLTILLTIAICRAEARSIRVSAEGGLRSIRMAIRMAAPGDTIFVGKGIYRTGNLVIDKPLHLIGEGNPVLDGADIHEIISIRSNRVSVRGFTFIRAGKSSYNDIAALRIIEASDITITHNRFINSFFGIYLQRAFRVKISENILTSNAKDEISSANGIHCWQSDQLDITSNTISGHRDGIYFEFVTNSTIRKNRSTGNVRYGLHFMFSSHDTYSDNLFRDNGAGVSVMYSHHVTMIRNIFADNWGNAAYGILMKEINDSEVRDNLIRHNTVGVLLEGSNRIQLEGNHFHDNGWAIRMQASCSDNNLKGNNFTANTFDIATNGSLVLNRFEGNYWSKYEGYDLNRDGIGDVPYRPVSLYSMIVERNPATLMLFRGFMTELMDRAERLLPGMTPEDLKDDKPSMRKLILHTPTQTS